MRNTNLHPNDAKKTLEYLHAHNIHTTAKLQRELEQKSKKVKA